MSTVVDIGRGRYSESARCDERNLAGWADYPVAFRGACLRNAFIPELDPARHAQIRHRTPTSTITTRPPWSTLKWTPTSVLTRGAWWQRPGNYGAQRLSVATASDHHDQAELTAAVCRRPCSARAPCARAATPTGRRKRPRARGGILTHEGRRPGRFHVTQDAGSAGGTVPPTCSRAGVKTVCELPREKLARRSDSRPQRPPLCGGRPLGGGRIAAVPAPS